MKEAVIHKSKRNKQYLSDSGLNAALFQGFLEAKLKSFLCRPGEVYMY